MKKAILLISLTLLAPGFLISCATQEATENDASATKQAQESAGKGTLTLVANGEDFIRQGFVSKDGWQIDFEHVYVTLNEVEAYQTSPPFDPEESEQLKPEQEVTLLAEPKTVDLAEGDGNADPITVTSEQAPMGTYNALSWAVVPANQEPAQGSTILLEGTAEKGDRTVNFTISFDEPMEYTCGQYVGDQRKGILEGTETAELETTFHFDHVFGSADVPADDALNQDAVGFEPFAALAQDGTLQADAATLEQQLADENYQKLQEAIAGLGHVGEGHCRMDESAAPSN